MPPSPVTHLDLEALVAAVDAAEAEASASGVVWATSMAAEITDVAPAGAASGEPLPAETAGDAEPAADPVPEGLATEERPAAEVQQPAAAGTADAEPLDTTDEHDEPEPVRPTGDGAPAPKPTPGPSFISRMVAEIREAIGFGEPGTKVWPDLVESAPAPHRSPDFGAELEPAPADDAAPVALAITAPDSAPAETRAPLTADVPTPRAAEPSDAPDVVEASEVVVTAAALAEFLSSDAAPPEIPGEETAVAMPTAPRTGVAALTWPRWRLPFPWNAFMAVLTGIETIAFLMFVLIEPTPRWVLLGAAGAAILGTDGVLRATYREPFEAGADTTPYLFLPALYTFAAPILIESNATGYAVALWGLVAGLGAGAITVAEVLSVRTGARTYPWARLLTNGAAYFAAFALLAIPYVLHIGLPASIVAAWLVCAMLGIELLREGEIDPLETVIFAAAVALVVAQARWLLFFLPLDGYLGGLALLLVFFLATGILHSHITRQLTALVAGAYVAIAVVGVAVVVAAHLAGIA